MRWQDMSKVSHRWKVTFYIKPRLVGLEKSKVKAFKVREKKIVFEKHEKEESKLFLETVTSSKDLFKHSETLLKCFLGVVGLFTGNSYSFRMGSSHVIPRVKQGDPGGKVVYLPSRSEPIKVLAINPISETIVNETNDFYSFIEASTEKDRITTALNFIYDAKNASSPEHAFLSVWIALTLVTNGLGRKGGTKESAIEAFSELAKAKIIDTNTQLKYMENFNEVYEKRQDIFFAGKKIQEYEVSNYMVFFKDLLLNYLEYLQCLSSPSTRNIGN